MALNKTFSNGQPLDAADLNELVRTANNAEALTSLAQQSATKAEAAASRVDNVVQNIPDGSAVTMQVQKNTEDIAQHTKAIGMYAKHVTIPLDHNYATDKVLRLNGQTGMVEAVDKPAATEDQRWGVTRLTAEALKAQHVDQGDTAFVYMLDAEGQNLMEDGIKVFVIETEVKGEDGQVIRRTLTSKFNAPNADVTLSGHLQTGYDLQPDQNLLICHPLSTSSVEFLRTAEGAKEATTKLNLTAMMEKLATKEGVFLQMIAGLAEGIWDTNPESGNAREWLVGRPVIGCPDLVIPRMADIDARSGQNKDIVVDKVAGGCVGGNQMVPQLAEGTTSTNGNVTVRHTGTGFTLSGTAQASTFRHSNIGRIKMQNGHSYLALGGGVGTSLQIESYGGAPIDVRNGNPYLIKNANVNADANVNIYIFGGSEFHGEEQKWVMQDLQTLFPLDQPFVTSLERNDATRVLTRLGIIALDD